MKIYLKKINICLAMFFLVGFVFSEGLFAVRKKGNRSGERREAEQVNRERNGGVNNLILALKVDDKSNKEIELYLETLCLIKFFRSVELQELNSLIKEAEVVGGEELITFFVRLKKDLYGEKNIFDKFAIWRDWLRSETYKKYRALLDNTVLKLWHQIF